MKIRLINQDIIDPTIQTMRKRTKNPAKIVRKGGPWAASLVLVPADFSSVESPPEGLVFDAYTANCLCPVCNLKTSLFLNARNYMFRIFFKLT